MNARKSVFDLEERLIKFALLSISVEEKLPKTVAGKHFSKQLIRSGSAPALLYAEAQSAESRKGFIHKMKIALKELRETYVCLKIIHRKPLTNDNELLKQARTENNELISIFVKSISTARKNLK